jgi:hypothetical protein
VLLFVLFALFEKEKFKRIISDLMLSAKSLAKDAILNSGKEQEEWVLEKTYIYLPRWITLFISKELMRKIISYLYRAAKDYIDDGEFNNSR